MEVNANYTSTHCAKIVRRSVLYDMLDILACQAKTHPAVRAHHPLLSSYTQELLSKMLVRTLSTTLSAFLEDYLFGQVCRRNNFPPLHRPDPKVKGWHPTRGRRGALESTSAQSVRGSGWVATPGPTWDKNASNATSTCIHTNRYFNSHSLSWPFVVMS